MVLIVISFFALIFTFIAKRSVEEATAFTDNVKARFAALSGINFALEKLPHSLTQNYTSFVAEEWVFNGEDININGELDNFEDINQNNKLDIFSVPLKDALRPSFSLYKDYASLQNEYSKISKITPPRNKSHYLNKAPENTVYFILKVKDTTQTLNLNDPNPKLFKMLKNLSDVMGMPISLDDAKEFVELTGKFTTLEELTHLKGTIKLPPNFATHKLRDFISLYGNTIDKLLLPNPKKELIGKKILSIRELLYSNLQTTKRSPININIAPPEIIEAVLKNLESIYVEENKNQPSILPDLNILDLVDNQLKNLQVPDILNTDDIDKFMKNITKIGILPRLQIFKQLKTLKSDNDFYGTVKTYKLSEGTSKIVARHIYKRRYKDPYKSAFHNFAEFREFLDELIKEKVINKLDRDIILANCNPNTDFNKFNPNAIFYKKIDKSDLLEYTTEFVFGPIGTFEVESTGIVEKQHQITAQKVIISVYDILNIIQHTTQKDFAEGFIKPNTSYDFPTERDKTLQTYPEGLEEYAIKNDIDGQLMLATIKTKIEKNHTFVASFENGYNATFAREDKNLVSDYFQENDTKPVLTSIFTKGTLYPDGVYSDLQVGYPFKGGDNLPFLYSTNFAFNPINEQFSHQQLKTLLGVISFWVKPNFDTQERSKTRSIFSAYSLLPDKKGIDRVLHTIFQAEIQGRYKGKELGSPLVLTDFTTPFIFLKYQDKTALFTDPYLMLEDRNIQDRYKLHSRGWTHIGIFLDEKGAKITISP